MSITVEFYKKSKGRGFNDLIGSETFESEQDVRRKAVKQNYAYIVLEKTAEEKLIIPASIKTEENRNMSLSNKEKQELSDWLIKQLKTFRPDLSTTDVCKVMSTTYGTCLKAKSQKKSV